MLTTNSNSKFQIEVQDSTVSILSGSTRLGNQLIYWGGTTYQINDLASFDGTPNVYQNTLAYLYNSVSTAVESALSFSAPSTTVAHLSIPYLFSDSTDTIYLEGYPLGVFTLYTPDGTNVSLISFRF